MLYLSTPGLDSGTRDFYAGFFWNFLYRGYNYTNATAYKLVFDKYVNQDSFIDYLILETFGVDLVVPFPWHFFSPAFGLAGNSDWITNNVMGARLRDESSPYSRFEFYVWDTEGGFRDVNVDMLTVLDRYLYFGTSSNRSTLFLPP